MCLAGLGIFSCSDTYDLGTKQPEGLNTIYNYMVEQGTFSNYLRLIDDLGQKEILSKTGSKTMFIADDAAFDKFYASNPWGVKSYEQLSDAQKKLLLNSSMIDNPYSTSMLSSAQSVGNNGKPVKGEVCRRSSSLALYDSVMVVSVKDPDGVLPHNSRFDEIRNGRDSIVLFTDASNAAPMLHFTGKFVTSNKMENTDIDFIYNQPEGTFKTDDVYVNDSRVIKSNIFCKNGFIHQVDKVILPLDNMAEIIRKNPNTKIYSRILERFAAPDDSLQLTEAYNKTKGKEVDSIFVKRYFSKRSAGSTYSTDRPFAIDKNGSPFDAALKYDPGWNGYVPDINNVREPMMEDMAVMLVPNDVAIEHWWTHGGGRVIADYYETIDKTPNSVLDKLINVNQLTSFAESVPSKFDEVLDDANEKMGISTLDIDSVYLGCNGLVYVTNRVFAPTSYSSVLFPSVIDTTNFRIIYNAIENMNYDKYLNSMVSKYIFLLPTNNGLLSYIDPVSYGSPTPKLWEFYLDLSKSSSKQICANVYDCQLNEDGTWVKDETNKPSQITGGTDNAIIKDRMEDLLDNIIVTRAYEEGKKYYMTKGRTFVKIEEKNGETYVSGSWQEERNRPLKAKQIYDMENGKAIVLDGPIMGTRNSVTKILSQNPDFSEFADVIKACGALALADEKDGWQAGDQEFGNLFSIKNAGAVGAEDVKQGKKASYILNNFHYTVYAPTNEAMAKAYAMGLPTLDMLEEAHEIDDSLGYDAAKDSASYEAKLMEAMLDFVKYHIQDNSIYVDNGFASGEYESGKTELIKSTSVNEETGETTWSGKYSPGRPYKLNVKVSADGISVTDCRNGYDPNTHQSLGGHTAKVIKEEGYYNLMAREYWYQSGSKISNPQSVQLNNSSAVVVHGIDSPLIYADGEHYDQKGLLVPSQFNYSHKPLTTEAKRRK